jgi:hypothetical protein
MMHIHFPRENLWRFSLLCVVVVACTSALTPTTSPRLPDAIKCKLPFQALKRTTTRETRNERHVACTSAFTPTTSPRLPDAIKCKLPFQALKRTTTRETRNERQTTQPAISVTQASVRSRVLRYSRVEVNRYS